MPITEEYSFRNLLQYGLVTLAHLGKVIHVIVGGF